MKKFIKTQGRYLIAGLALITAFILSIEFNNRGLQWDLDKGGSAFATPDRVAPSYNLAGAEIVNKVLLQLNEKYVDPTRFRPERMLVYALDEVQKAVPEVVVSFDRAPDDNPTRATVAVNGQSRAFNVRPVESLWEMSFRLKEIFLFLQNNLTESDDLKFANVEYAAINGMLSTLDPHSVLLSPEVFKEMQTQTGGKFGGLGIVVGLRDNQLTIINPMEDTPASKAGLKTGDRLIRINEESTVNMSLSDAVQRLRGEPGTDVALWISRKGWTEPRRVELTRAIINIESVESHMLSQKVGYVKIKSFQANTHSDLKRQLEALHKKSGGMSGLVIDLRNNPGGLLDQAVKIADTFLDEGTIVSTVGFGNKIRDENKATKRNTEPRYPIVVLVDPGSASASEIVSGALKNHDRAVIVGDTTFGKGSVQVIYELGDGSAVKLTIAQYLTPGDVSIQSVGIVPDVQLQAVSIAEKNIDLFASDRISREADLSAHLDHASAKAGAKPSAVIRYLDPDAARAAEQEQGAPEEADEPGFKEDFAIRFAQRTIRAAGTTWERPDMLRVAAPTVRSLADGEMKDITAALARIGVDWAEGPNPPSPALEVALTTDKPGGEVKAGEKVTLTATVTNKGTAPVHRLYAITDTDNDLFDDRELVFGRINPGESRTWSIEAEIPRHWSSRDDVVQLHFGAMDQPLNKRADVVVRTLGGDRPHFAFSYLLDDSEGGNGDGILQPGERVKLSVLAVNDGIGDAGKTLGYLRNQSEAAVFLKEGRDEINAIKSGGSARFDFSFEVQSVPEDNLLRVEVELFDELFREFATEKLNLRAERTASRNVEPTTGTLTLQRDAKVFVAATAEATPFARISQGQKVKVVGRSGDMLRVLLDKDLPGWVEASTGALSPAPGPLTVAYDPLLLRTPPRLAWKQRTAITSSPTFRLDGVARDDGSVKDYYVFVHTRDGRRYDTTKVTYQRGGGHELKLDAEVPLKPGMNRIRVTVRDDDDMNATETLFVYRR